MLHPIYCILQVMYECYSNVTHVTSCVMRIRLRVTDVMYVTMHVTTSILHASSTVVVPATIVSHWNLKHYPTLQDLGTHE